MKLHFTVIFLFSPYGKAHASLYGQLFLEPMLTFGWHSFAHRYSTNLPRPALRGAGQERKWKGNAIPPSRPQWGRSSPMSESFSGLQLGSQLL